MIDFTDPKQVKTVQSALQTLPIWHKDNMEFLEQICGWYDFNQTDPNVIVIQHGKRQVLATLKTFLDLNPEQVAQIAIDRGHGL